MSDRLTEIRQIGESLIADARAARERGEDANAPSNVTWDEAETLGLKLVDLAESNWCKRS